MEDLLRILLTNDDGVYAPGLRAMRTALQKLGDVTVVAPVGEQSAAGHSGHAAGARKLLAERPSQRHGKLRLGPPRRRRHTLGHPVDHDELGRRRRRPCAGTLNRVGYVTCDTDRKQCEAQD